MDMLRYNCTNMQCSPVTVTLVKAFIMKQRSTEKELMDQGPAFYTPKEYADCLNILFKINKLMGFFKSTVTLFKRFPNDSSVIDVGCGGGAFLRHLSAYYPNMKLMGIDVSESAVEQANNELHYNISPNLTFQVQEQLALTLPEDSVDIVLTTLVCHHMDDQALVAFLKNAYRASRKAVVINDLHRHVVAFWFYKLISPLFRNRLITHDGLISIQRGFTRAEWKQFLLQANVHNYQINWCFPFRWQVVLWKS